MDIVKKLRRWSPEESTHELHEDAADEIERLRKALADLYEVCRWEKVAPEIDAAKAALAKATGGE
jgi:hypothetical protein